MSESLLVAQLARITDDADAFQKLRRFVLDLAVRGKLTEQNADEEPASTILARVPKAFPRTGRERSVARAKPEREARKECYPFVIPRGWAWCALGEIAQYGQVAKVDSNSAIAHDTWVLDLEDIERESSKLIERRCSSDRPFRSAKTRFERDDVLLGKLRPYLNKVLVADQEGVCSSEIVPIRCFDGIVPEYLRIVLKSPLTMMRVESLMYGMKMPRLGTEDATALPCPLPPRGEQHRIVAKVEEVMSLCNELQDAQMERERRRDRLAKFSLQRLTKAGEATAAAFYEHARFNLSNLARVTARPGNIALLRHAIVRLALRGHVAPQDASEEPASELLARVHKQRTEMLVKGYPNEAEGSAQLQKQGKQCVPTGLRSLPQGWQWATLMQCSALVVDCHNKTAPYSSSGVLLLRTTNIRDGAINLKEARFVDEATYARWSARCAPESGDFLITREAPMGEACIIPSGMRICMGQRMMLVRLVADTIDPRFMLLSLRDPDLMERVQDKPVGTTVQHLRVGGIETLLIAIPPLAEQVRIVAKVDEVMAICDTLELQLRVAAEEGRLLLDALVHRALGPAA